MNEFFKQWLPLVQTVGILAGLWFTGRTLILNGRQQRATTLMTVTQYHRQIWSQLLSAGGLARVLQADASTTNISESERTFVLSVILHLNSVFEAIRAGALPPIEGIDTDVREFLSKPVPSAVWLEVSHVQNQAFAQFVSRALAPEQAGRSITQSWWKL